MFNDKKNIKCINDSKHINEGIKVNTHFVHNFVHSFEGMIGSTLFLRECFYFL